MEFKTIEKLLEFTKGIKGKSFEELDKYGYLENKRDKGRYGKIVETGFYKYSTNNDARADFESIGVELKVAGFIKNKNKTIKSKERISLGMIDYDKLIFEEFEFSKLLFKNKKLLIIWYEYLKGVEDKKFVIQNYQLYDMSIDLETIRADFYLIKNKVSAGEAHLLSEGDTSYLGAATKGSKGQTRSQPKSSKLAKPRCFSLKQSYVTGILRSIDSKLISNSNFTNVVDYINFSLNNYFEKTQIDILNSLGVFIKKEKIPKNLNKMISDRLIGKDNELEKKDELFKKTRFIIKNIPLNTDGYPIERMSFRNLILSEFEENWEESEWKLFFEEVTIILICYEGSRKVRNGYRVLKDVKKITFTEKDIEEFEKSYNLVKETIKKRDINCLPIPLKKNKKGRPLVVAPKSTKGASAYINFFEKETTKVCFMLEKEFISKKIKPS